MCDKPGWISCNAIISLCRWRLIYNEHTLSGVKKVSGALVKSLCRAERLRVPYPLRVSVARTQLAITALVLPEDGVLFNQSTTGWSCSFKRYQTLASVY